MKDVWLLVVLVRATLSPSELNCRRLLGARLWLVDLVVSSRVCTVLVVMVCPLCVRRIATGTGESWPGRIMYVMWLRGYKVSG